MTLRGKTPKLGKSCFIAESADIIGDVKIGDNCSIWYRTVLRGDVMPIVVGDETNIQDGTIIHGTYKKCGTTLGKRVTIGHGVILHGCNVGDETLIGMGSILMDNSRIGKNCVVGAGSLVTEESVFPDRSLIMGRPAKVKRELTEEEVSFLSRSADNYLHYSEWYLEGENNGQ